MLAISAVVTVATVGATIAVASSPQTTGPNWGWIAAVGFCLTVLGVAISLAGFAITLEQIQKTNDEVADTQREAEALRKSLVTYSAAHDAALAGYAIKSAKRHYMSKANPDFVEAYDDFRRAIVSIRKNVEQMPPDVSLSIDQADKYIVKLCKRLEAGSVINDAKVLSELRSHQDLISNLIAILNRVAIQ